VVKLVIPAPEPDAGTYLPVYDGHGDALNLSKLDPVTGSLTLANSFRYESWGKPATTTHNGVGDLGFRFLYVGEFDVQWDDQLGLGLLYMHARHYSPALGRFLQPDPDRSDANLYAYAANDPLTELDPDGTCFIVCAIANALIDTGIYFATTDRSEWSLGGAAGAAATGAVTGFLGVGLLSKIGKVGALARAGSKLLGKMPRAARAVRAVRRVPSRIREGYRKLEDYYSWRNVRARHGPAKSVPNRAFPRAKEYKELTHVFIPKRSPVPNFIKNSGWNLCEKWGTNHALSDPSRYRFMPRWWKAANPLPRAPVRAWRRLWAD
jgi:RHS repeat-associated protein